MKRTLLLATLAVLAFACILLARLPMRWAAGFLPPSVQCNGTAGTVWNGSCATLIANGMPVGRVTWKLHPLRLFTGKLATHLEVTRADRFLRGEIESSFDRRDITLRDVTANVPLDRSLAPQFPPNLSGKGNVQLALVRMQGGVITAVQGRVEARDLEQRGSQRYPLGDYAVTFPGGEGEPVGQVESLRGPLDVKGTLRLTREPGFALEGTVAVQGNVDPQLARQLEYLGSPDPQGRRPFSVAGTF